MNRICQRSCVAIFLAAVLAVSVVGADAVKPLDPAAQIADLLGAIKGTHAKVVLLNMWGIACSPCLAELPILARVAAKLKNDPNVAFLGLCIPEGDVEAGIFKTAATLIDSKKVAYKNMVWTGKGEALLDKFNVFGTPYTAVVAADGSILAQIEISAEEEDKAVDLLEKGIAKALEAVKVGAAAKK